MNPHLCSRCRDIFSGRWTQREIQPTEHDASDDSDEDFDTLEAHENPKWLHCQEGSEEPAAHFHHDFQDLRISAEAGCILCVMLWDLTTSALMEPDKGFDDRAISTMMVRPRELEDSEGRVCLELFGTYFVEGRYGDGDEDEFVPHHVTLELQLVEGDSNEPAQATPVTSQRQLDALNHWVRECQARPEHSECRPLSISGRTSDKKTFLPTRLLKIESLARGLSVRLVNSSHLDDHVIYATLSHCWGGSLPMRLLKSNVNALQQGIAIDDLPQTFQDAISFIEHLGPRYLWIDALCIVQDDPEDWLRESLLMGDVYSFGVLNVAATISPNSHGGLLQQESGTAVEPCVVEATWSNYPMGRYVCVDHTAFERKVETGPLNQRSWVFQERILAPRTIHFAQEQIWWQCRGHLACQSFPSGVPKDSQVLGWQEYSPKGYFDPYMPLFMPLGQLPFAFVRGEDESGYRLWRWVVERYSQTQLTKDSDRLVALAGVTAAICSRMGWSEKDYVAGWWKQSLVHGLLWIPHRGSRSHDKLVPTWSWASQKGRVRYFETWPEGYIGWRCLLSTRISRPLEGYLDPCSMAC